MIKNHRIRETKATEDEMEVEDWDYWLYFVNIYAAHATPIPTLDTQKILQSRQLQQVWQLANVRQYLILQSLNGFDTMYACADLPYLLCIGLLSAEFPTVKT